MYGTDTNPNSPYRSTFDLDTLPYCFTECYNKKYMSGLRLIASVIETFDKEAQISSG